MTIQQFIEKAIEGGWKNPSPVTLYNNGEVRVYENARFYSLEVAEILLDPLAWQAVGKVEGWGKTKNGRDTFTGKNWKREMRRMTDALIEGKTIEDFIATL